MGVRRAKRGSGTWAAVIAAALLSAACAAEPSPRIARELEALDGRVTDGVAKIERALAAPGLTFPELGEGVRIVERAARELGALEVDDRASDGQRLVAALLQARAFDDVARAFADARPPEALDPAQHALFAELLEDKARPARSAAAEGFRRARRVACQLGQSDHPAMLEILDGVGRYGEPAAPACE